MSRKFFSLIKGGTLTLAPKNKVIPADQFSSLLDAKETLEVVQKDAESYKMDIASDCEKLKEQAIKEGYEEGFKQWADHVLKLEEKINQVQRSMEEVIAPLALKAAKKIVGRELETNKATVVDIVSNNLKAVAQHKRIVIYVNKKDINILEEHRPRLKELFERLESLSIRDRDDIEESGCIIETEGGIINAQLSNKWETLERAFTALLKSQDSPLPESPPPEPEPAAEDVAEETLDDDEEIDE